MDRDRLPYFEQCREGRLCDEYPVLTMYTMRAAAAAAADSSTFFFVTALFLAACGLATVWLVHATVGGRARALMFAAAPSLAAYAFISWDLLAVALASAAALALIRERPGLAGALLALGISAKLYPIILLAPFVVELHRRGRLRHVIPLGVWTVGAFALINVPFAVAAPDGWSTFFRFSAERSADYNSLWHVACRFGQEGGVLCPWEPGAINLVSTTIVVAGAVATLAHWGTRTPRRSGLHLVLPLLVIFLLANKVFSPQYSLWLLPWFAYTLRDLRLFAFFSLADLGVYVTGFLWFGRLASQTGQPGFEGFTGFPSEAYHVALIVRAVALALILMWWFRNHGRSPSDDDQPNGPSRSVHTASADVST